VTHHAPRLLPWTTPEGNPAYVVGDGTGHVSRIADDMERVQLAMAVELLGHAGDLLADKGSTTVQLRYLLARMSESLTAVHRIAESRGARV
jgi:hypothetical protein